MDQQLVVGPNPNLIAEPLVFHEDELTETTLPGKFVTVLSLVDIFLLFLILLTIAIIKDIKINRERHPIFLPFRPPRGFRLYAVLLETGQSPAGGTSAKVFLRIVGKLTKTPGFTLICTSRQRRYGSKHIFGSQNKDIFILSVPHYLGGIESFEVMTDRRGDSPPWFLRSIRVISLNNRKCWKSEVSAWLRGDKKPYSIKANLIGALSTKEHFLKVFVQSHLWLAPWFRSLGSSFMSAHRILLLWISVGCSVWINHYFLYDEGLLENIRENKLVTKQYTANDIARAACLSSMGGVILAMILCQITVFLTGGTKWERLDDKDDLCHLMKPRVLEFAQGAVVPRSTFQPAGDYLSLTDLAHLTQDQRRAIKHITECQISDCSLKRMINDPQCSPHKNCSYNKGRTSFQTPIFTSAQESQPFQSKQEDVIQPRVSISLHQKEGYLDKNQTNVSSNFEKLCDCEPNQTNVSPDFKEVCGCEPRLVHSDDVKKCPQYYDESECCFDRRVSSCTNFWKPSCGASEEHNENTKKSSKNRCSRKSNGKEVRNNSSSKQMNKDKGYANAYNFTYTTAQTTQNDKKAKKLRKSRNSKKQNQVPFISAQALPTHQTQSHHGTEKTSKTKATVYAQGPTTSATETSKNKKRVPQGCDKGPKPDLINKENKSNKMGSQSFIQESKKAKKQSKTSKTKGGIPQVSARTESITSDIFLDAQQKTYENGVYSVGDHFDSVSEPESDQEIVTKSARTDLEINLIKRPAITYNTAPQWHDKYHVWTEAPKGGTEHHTKLNRRYDFAIGTASISGSNQLSQLERAIQNYLLEEQHIPAGEVNLPNTLLASFLVSLLALGALVLSGYVVYQRLFISNGDSLIFLYSLVFSLLLHIFLFSTVAAVFCSMLASYRRRYKILLRREQNARRY